MPTRAKIASITSDNTKFFRNHSAVVIMPDWPAVSAAPPAIGVSPLAVLVAPIARKNAASIGGVPTAMAAVRNTG